jgi:ribonuclease P protein component
MLGRLLRKSDFERLLAVPPCSRSTHFAVHHLLARPSLPHQTRTDRLCTGDAPETNVPVDNIIVGHWLGTVIPKRHAARSVTRNLLRRQVRSAMLRHQPRLRAGLWVVRLRRPFDKGQFVSAASAALRRAAAVELDQLLRKAAA